MRFWFGQTPADWTIELAGDRSVLAKGGVALTFWSAPAGGFQYTDLLLADGTVVTKIFSGDGGTAPLGTIPRFQGPDGVTLVFADAGAGTRWAMPCSDLGTELASHVTSADPHGDRAWATTNTRQAVAQLAAQYGSIPLDSFEGATDDARFTTALAYARAQTVKPTIVIPNRPVTLSSGPWEFFNGLKISGPIAAGEREFLSTAQAPITLTAPMFTMPANGSDVRDMSFRGLQFRAASNTVDWMVRVTDFNSGPIMQDADFRDVGWNGFSSVMHARHLRCSIERMYCNNGVDTQFKIGGSDNYYWTEGRSFLSGALPATAYYIHFTHMSRTTVGELYITPQLATAVRLDGTYGNLVFRGTRFDSTGRTQANACQGSAVFINAGEGYVFDSCWFFNNAVAPATTGRSDKGQVYIKTGVKEVLFTGCAWGGGSKQPLATPAGTPAIYCQTGVTNVRVANPLGPNGAEKKLQQAAEGIITCNDPTWIAVTAA